MRITGGWTTLRSIWMLSVCLCVMIYYIKEIDMLGWILGGPVAIMFLVDAMFHIRWKE